MTRESLTIGGKNCRMFSLASPAALLVRPMGLHEEPQIDREAELIAGSAGKPFVLAAFEIRNWEEELTPWPDSAISASPAVGTHARTTLEYIEQKLLPRLKESFGSSLPIIIGGYSLAGLFALWAATETDLFRGVAAASPSVWIKNWNDYAASRPTNARQIFLSLGKREEKTRNKAIAQVGNNLRSYHSLLETQIGADNTTLVWNDGGHFNDSTRRTADAFAWNLKKLTE